MTLADLQAKFPRASKAFIERNAHLYETIASNSVDAPKRKRSAPPALDQKPPAKSGRKIRVVVRLIAVGGRPRDDDNVAGGYKALRDAIANTLGVDDGDSRIRFTVHHCRD